MADGSGTFMASVIAIETVRQGATLLRAMLWPAVVVGLALLFRDSLVALLARISTVTLTAPGGVSVTAAARAAALLQAAASARRARIGPDAPMPTLLWVDTEPDAACNEIAALATIGVRVIVERPDAALARLAAQRFGLVILASHGSDPAPSTHFLEAARAADPNLPVLLYTDHEGAPGAPMPNAVWSGSSPDALFTRATDTLGVRTRP